jgi:hypothetical protein
MMHVLNYWRTILLILVTSIAVANLCHDPMVVILATTAAAFLFSHFERRRWLEVPFQVLITDIMSRVMISTVWSLAIFVTPIVHLVHLA